MPHLVHFSSAIILFYHNIILIDDDYCANGGNKVILRSRWRRNKEQPGIKLLKDNDAEERQSEMFSGQIGYKE